MVGNAFIFQTVKYQPREENGGYKKFKWMCRAARLRLVLHCCAFPLPPCETALLPFTEEENSVLCQLRQTRT